MDRGQITPVGIIVKLILPSLVCLIVPVLIVQSGIKGSFQYSEERFKKQSETLTTPQQQKIILLAEMGIILLVPVFQGITGLPPFMAMLLGLGLALLGFFSGALVYILEEKFLW